MHPLITCLWVSGRHGCERRLLQRLECRDKGRVGLLTLERSDEHVPILDELFDEFICPLQLYFMAFETLSEVRTVQERVTELQSGESHCTSTTKKSCLSNCVTRHIEAFTVHHVVPIFTSPPCPKKKKKVFLLRSVPHFRFFSAHRKNSGRVTPAG